MKQLVTALLVSASLTASVIVFAQSEDQELKQYSKQHRLIEKLNLTDERAEEVKAVMKDFHQKKKAIHENTREQIQALMTEQKAVLEGILTEEEMEIAMKQFNKHRKHKKMCKHHREY